MYVCMFVCMYPRDPKTISGDGVPETTILEWSFFTGRWETFAKQVRFTSCQNLQTRLVILWQAKGIRQNPRHVIHDSGPVVHDLDLSFTPISRFAQISRKFHGLLSAAAFQTKRNKNLLPRMKSRKLAIARLEFFLL